MPQTDPNFRRQTALAACLFCCRKRGESEKYMRVFGKINIIGLDNGYGNIKTANGIFPASVEYNADLHSMGQYIQEGPLRG